MLHHMHVSIGRWLFGSERSQQIYCQSYFRKVVLGFKINLEKLKGASLLYLLILLSWVVSPHFRCFCCLKNFSSTSHQFFFFFLETVFAPIQKWIRISNLSGFRIPDQCGFRIPVHWIPDSKIKNLLDSGFRILLHEAMHGLKTVAYPIETVITKLNYKL